MYNKILSKYINNELRGDYSGYGLEGIEILLSHLGNPHYSFKSIHIAGTNGKGTTSSLISSSLIASGYKTGLYTSPHLLRINERIKISGEEISDEEIYKYAVIIDNIITSNKDLRPTYFDILTAIAFLYFADSPVDIAVVETGLGGKLDSTNVLVPEVSVITEISIDHASVLGSTIELIAAEKAGIIKSGIPVVSLCTDKSAAGIVESAAEMNNSPAYIIGKDFNTDHITDYENGYEFNYSFNQIPEILEGITIPLRPEHQVKNAAAALTALMLLREKGYSGITSSLLLNAFSNITLPGRFQVLERSPLILFDAAHNYSALLNLFDCIDRYYSRMKLRIILSIMGDKINDDVRLLLYQKKDSILYFIFQDDRLYIPFDGEFRQITSEIEVIAQFIASSGENDLILFTGTFRLYKHALDVITRLRS